MRAAASLVSIERSDVSEMLARCGNLFGAHQEEIGPAHPEVGPPRPNELRYRALEQAGCLLCLIAKTDDGNPVGYSVAFISQDMHDEALTVAQSDVLFVSRHWRATGVGHRLMQATREAAREMGADLIAWHARPMTKAANVLEHRCGPPRELIFVEQLPSESP